MSKRVLVPFRNPQRVETYLAALRNAGLQPEGRLTDRSAALDGFFGLVLMGGTDVNPNVYGETAIPETDPPDDERDRVELNVLKEAMEKNLPIFAICRGMQLLNVSLRGTLIQHLGALRHDPDFEDRSKPAHDVEVMPGTLLHGAVGVTRLDVNSRHHQAVSKLGEGLRVSARDSEHGTIEAIEHSARRFVLGVQWHPEDQVAADPLQFRLFQSFAEAVLKD